MVVDVTYLERQILVVVGAMYLRRQILEVVDICVEAMAGTSEVGMDCILGF